MITLPNYPTFFPKRETARGFLGTGLTLGAGIGFAVGGYEGVKIGSGIGMIVGFLGVLAITTLKYSLEVSTKTLGGKVSLVESLVETQDSAGPSGKLSDKDLISNTSSNGAVEHAQENLTTQDENSLLRGADKTNDCFARVELSSPSSTTPTASLSSSSSRGSLSSHEDGRLVAAAKTGMISYNEILDKDLLLGGFSDEGLREAIEVAKGRSPGVAGSIQQVLDFRLSESRKSSSSLTDSSLTTSDSFSSGFFSSHAGVEQEKPNKDDELLLEIVRTAVQASLSDFEKFMSQPREITAEGYDRAIEAAKSSLELVSTLEFYKESFLEASRAINEKETIKMGSRSSKSESSSASSSRKLVAASLKENLLKATILTEYLKLLSEAEKETVFAKVLEFRRNGSSDEFILKNLKECKAIEYIPVNLSNEPIDFSNAVQTVNKGLKNLENTCWLTSIVKLIATTHMFDGLLDADQGSNLQVNELRQSLKNLVECLRGGPGDENDLYEIFFVRLQEFSGGLDFPRIEVDRQEDAGEWLDRLMNALEWKPPEALYAKKLRNASSADGKYKQYGSYEKLESKDFRTLPILKVNIRSDDEGDIDLSERLQEDDVRELEYSGQLNDQHERIGMQYSERLTELPKSLIISIDRKSVDARGNHVKKFNSIKVEDDGYVHLKEHEPIMDSSDRITGSRLKGVVRYRIDAAIIHRGKGSGGGHYLLKKRGEDGIGLHNDSLVTLEGNERDGFGGDASLIRLERVDY